METEIDNGVHVWCTQSILRSFSFSALPLVTVQYGLSFPVPCTLRLRSTEDKAGVYLINRQEREQQILVRQWLWWQSLLVQPVIVTESEASYKYLLQWSALSFGSLHYTDTITYFFVTWNNEACCILLSCKILYILNNYNLMLLRKNLVDLMKICEPTFLKTTAIVLQVVITTLKD